MTVIARHIRRLKSHHRTRLDDKILEYFIERRADVNIGISIRRAVVEDKFLTPRTLLEHHLIKSHFLPFLQTRRFHLPEIRLLRKIGSR